MVGIDIADLGSMVDKLLTIATTNQGGFVLSVLFGLCAVTWSRMEVKECKSGREACELQNARLGNAIIQLYGMVQRLQGTPVGELPQLSDLLSGKFEL